MNAVTVAGASLAGQKIRAFRKAQQPRLSGEAMAERLQISKAHFYRIESEGRVPDHATALALVDMGICSHEDFHKAALAECGQCSLPESHPLVTQCDAAGCPRRKAQ